MLRKPGIKEKYSQDAHREDIKFYLSLEAVGSSKLFSPFCSAPHKAGAYDPFFRFTAGQWLMVNEFWKCLFVALLFPTDNAFGTMQSLLASTNG